MPPKRSSSRRSSRGRNSENDLEKVEISRRSRRSALIQITFGRAAHSLSTMAAIMLAITAIIIFLLTNWDAFADGTPDWLEDVKWLIPLAVGIGMSATIIYLKWDPFMTDRTERPFIVSYFSLAVPLATAVVIVLNSIGQLDVGAGRWVYPTSFIGISLSLVSIAMIWEGMSRRKTIVIVSALIPLAIMSVPALFRSDTILDILPIVYLGSALCIQLSGSMMHLMSTTTSVHERELLKASDAKIVTMREELEMRREEIEFREKGVRDREVELETYEKRLHDIKLDLDERERRVERVESNLESREEKVIEEKKRVKSMEFDIASREEVLDHRKRELDVKEKDQQALIADFNEKVGQLDKVKSQLQDEQSELSRWAKELEESEVLMNEELERLRTSREALLAENKLLAEKEKELELKESSLEMKLISAESARAAPGDSDRVKTLREWEERILLKERQIAEKETELSKKRIEATEIMKQAERRESRADEKAASLEEKDKELKERESLVRELQGEISRDKAKMQHEKVELEASREDLASLRDRYELLIKSTGEKADKFTSNEEMMERKMSALDAREEKIKSLQDRLKKEIEEIEKRRREIIDLDKKMSAKNSDLEMRELEIRERSRRLEERLAKGAIEGSETSALLDDLRQREKSLRVREKKLEERERDLQKRLYEAKKTAEEAAKSEEEIAPSAEEKPERISSGTKRLDDLLYGGFPYGSSVLFVGPPFSGKEIAVLSFISDGLKAGIPAIIITTSRSPGDLLKDFAPILPTFLEIERLGLVKWIDATGGKEAKGSSVQMRKNLIKVEGPDDLPGILEAIEKFSEDVRRGDYPYFKLGYLSLSTSIAHSGEIEAAKFIQAMTRVVRERSSAGLFALEKGMHSDQQIESIQHLMDGALNVKLDKQKTFLSVVGVGEVQTRDWIEFKHTNKGLIIGAFSLERIR